MTGSVLHGVVAIDGPSGSGKSTVARRVAAALDAAYLDTGAMYRAAAWWLRDLGVDLADQQAVAARIGDLPLDISTDPAAPTVAVAGRDISTDIRSTEISAIVSQVSTNLAVRREMIARQRAIVLGCAAGEGLGAGIVAEGRDITTVVAPDAATRVLLTASPQVRLSRRALDVHGSADAASVSATRDQVVRRDADDSAVASFLEPAPGVALVDSSDLTLEQTVDAVLRMAQHDPAWRARERQEAE